MRMIFKWVLLVIIGSDRFRSGVAMINKIKSENMALLKELQANLRRNNDDYIESTPTTETQTIANTTGNQDNVTVLIENRRRETDNRTVGPVVKALPTAGVLLFRSFTKTTKVPKKRQNKLLQFIKKNKGKLERLKPLMTRQRANILDLTEVVKQATRAGAHWAVPQGPVEEEIPSEVQLDMAPAKGSRIHLMRISGRMCQRSVLLPEGPKYDHQGKVYLPLYKGRSFAATKEPDLVLPRCCNCCKKSVLGCE